MNGKRGTRNDERRMVNVTDERQRNRSQPDAKWNAYGCQWNATSVCVERQRTECEQRADAKGTRACQEQYFYCKKNLKVLTKLKIKKKLRRSFWKEIRFWKE